MMSWLTVITNSFRKKIADKGLAIKDDISKVLDDVVAELEK